MARPAGEPPVGVTPDGVAVSDHVSLSEPAAIEPDAAPGVYRVVGTGSETVTLLRVADADARREHTGEVFTVDRDDLTAFEPADDPDDNRPVGQRLRDGLDTLGWQLRTFVGSLADSPRRSTLAGAVLLVGLVGEQFVSAPEGVFSVAVFAGSLSLAALGSNLL
ncbi:hypothetical protein GBQ70_09105 [Halomicrobium sp. ZPS1]|uniref:Uncharacterized protein n=1 Tax=Halomicrobium mukohataei TaxID=57705 RepID=A0A4D6KJ23_9EURY|nr:hypothetical protein E5139_09110 [Halomicrobium mukohataei]QFR20588.1 hypothetical protein GBQ70_09105 [Halomicrobium sp. ZPS1]